MTPAPAVRSAGMGESLYKIVILAALPWELRPFLRHSQARPLAGAGFPAWEFGPERARGLAAVTGMGAAAARARAEAILAGQQPEVLISLGFGGAVTPELPPGALVLGEDFWEYDPETQALALVPAPSSPRSLAELRASLAAAGMTVFQGSVVTTPYVIHKGRQGGPLQGLRHPALDLETSGLARLAAARGVSLLSLRAITDGAAEEIPEIFTHPEDGETGRGRALKWLAGDPRRLPVLLRLWRRSRRAAQVLAQALILLLPLLVPARD